MGADTETRFWPKAVGAGLSCDLLRSGSKTSVYNLSGCTPSMGLRGRLSLHLDHDFSERAALQVCEGFGGFVERIGAGNHWLDPVLIASSIRGGVSPDVAIG